MKRFAFDPLSHWGNALQAGHMLAEAQTVIAMRLMGMAGIWSVTPAEQNLMLSEKIQATVEAATNASKAMMGGAASDKVVAAALKPYRQKTRANARRLGKRGIKAR
jgi:hypothetical protein